MVGCWGRQGFDGPFTTDKHVCQPHDLGNLVMIGVIFREVGPGVRVHGVGQWAEGMVDELCY